MLAHVVKANADNINDPNRVLLKTLRSLEVDSANFGFHSADLLLTFAAVLVVSSLLPSVKAYPFHN